MLISELQTSNKITVKDEDGAASDWLELFNGGASTVSLAVGGGGRRQAAGWPVAAACVPARLLLLGALRLVLLECPPSPSWC